MRPSLCSTVVVAMTLIVSTGAHAEPIFPKSSGVGLEPPKGMAVADDFLGFQLGKASIVIAEMPAVAYEQLNGSRERFAEKITGAKPADFSASGANGFIVRGKQTVAGQTYRKWAVVVGGKSQTAMVTAQVPVGDKSVSDASIEAALRTITLRDRPGLSEQVDALPFTVTDLSGFRPVLTVAGASLGLTEGPKDVDPQARQPSVTISTSLQHPPPDTNHLDYAKALLQSIKAVGGLIITSERLFDADGVQWAELEARGARSKAETPVNVLFLLRFGKGESISVIATAPTDDYPRFADRFRNLALSIRPKS